MAFRRLDSIANSKFSVSLQDKDVYFCEMERNEDAAASSKRNYDRDDRYGQAGNNLPHIL